MSDDNRKSIIESNFDKLKDQRARGIRDIFRLDNFIISQNTIWKGVFDTFILLIVGYSCITSVMYISFSF